MRWQLAAGVAALSLLPACAGAGGGGSPTAATSGPPAPQAQAANSAPSATEPAAATTNRATMGRVVHEWSRLLDAGDNLGAARLFSLPAAISQAGIVLHFASYAQLAQWHATLPCAGTIETVSYETDVALAIFVLGDRATGTCAAPPGTKAAARFHFEDGRIVTWEEVAVPEQGASTQSPVAA
jgi:hypothetical protein